MRNLNTIQTLLTQVTKCLLICIIAILSACNSEDDLQQENTPQKKTSIKTLQFKIRYADYNSTDSIDTRAVKPVENDTLHQELIELDNGLLAEVTLRKDTADLSEKKPVTRAAAGDAYTMLVYMYKTYNAGTDEETGAYEVIQTIDGVMTEDSKFRTTTPVNLGPGDYQFVLYDKQKVTPNNNNIFTMPTSQDDKAPIGMGYLYIDEEEESREVSPEVTISMQRMISRVRFQLTALMHFETPVTATITTIDATAPTSASYNIEEGWTTAGSTNTTFSNDFSFGSSPRIYKSEVDKESYKSQFSTYTYYPKGTQLSKFRIILNSGTLYNLNLANSKINFSMPERTLGSNESYTININLKYNFFYLMSDGTVGGLKATTYGGGTKTPVAVVLSSGKRLAMALTDANGGQKTTWTPYIVNQYERFDQKNHQAFQRTEAEQAFADMDGYKYTWLPEGSLDGQTIKAEQKDFFPAFYYAGNYGTELSAELAKKGIRLSGGMENKKWHLPSLGELVYLNKALMLGYDQANFKTLDNNEGNSVAYYGYSGFYYGYLLTTAFTQVGGKAINNEGARFLMTSTEVWYDNQYRFGYGMLLTGSSIHTFLSGVFMKYSPGTIRPFIYY